MKKQFEDDLKSLLTGEVVKQDVLVLCETETPGVFEFRDKVVTEEQIIELEKGYKKTVRFVHVK